MVARLRALWEHLNGSYWFLPTVMGVAGLLLSIATLAVDRVVDEEQLAALPFVPMVRAEGARAVLTTVASSMITVGGVVFSLTLLVLTQAASQFGPRLLVNFMRDRTNQAVLGAFVATFVFALMVLRVVTGGSDDMGLDPFVPQVSVLVALVLTFATVGLLVYFFHHVAESVRVTHVLADIGRSLDRMLERLPVWQEGDGPEDDPDAALAALAGGVGTFRARHGGFLQEVHVDILVAIATERDAVVRLLPMVGAYVMRGAPVAEVTPTTATDAVGDRLHETLVLGEDRSMTQDPGFLFDEYLEIALRALSPSMQDPFTARACVDRIGEGLLLLDGRQVARRVHRDEHGTVRALVPAPTAAALTRRLFTELRYAAGDDPIVVQHLAVVLDLLRDESRDARLRRAAAEQLDALRHGDDAPRHRRRAAAAAEASGSGLAPTVEP